MRIKKIVSQNRRDLTILFECEHCGHECEKYGYDDTNYHQNVVPKLKCPECDRHQEEWHRQLSPKYAEHEVV